MIIQISELYLKFHNEDLNGVHVHDLCCDVEKRLPTAAKKGWKDNLWHEWDSNARFLPQRRYGKPT